MPYGHTATYAELASMVGDDVTVQAVRAAAGRNPICVFIPSHRIVGRPGELTGYAGLLPGPLGQHDEINLTEPAA